MDEQHSLRTDSIMEVRGQQPAQLHQLEQQLQYLLQQQQQLLLQAQSLQQTSQSAETGHTFDTQQTESIGQSRQLPSRNHQVPWLSAGTADKKVLQVATSFGSHSDALEAANQQVQALLNFHQANVQLGSQQVNNVLDTSQKRITDSRFAEHSVSKVAVPDLNATFPYNLDSNHGQIRKAGGGISKGHGGGPNRLLNLDSIRSRTAQEISQLSRDGRRQHMVDNGSRKDAAQANHTMSALESDLQVKTNAELDEILQRTLGITKAPASGAKGEERAGVCERTAGRGLLSNISSQHEMGLLSSNLTAAKLPNLGLEHLLTTVRQVEQRSAELEAANETLKQIIASTGDELERSKNQSEMQAARISALVVELERQVAAKQLVYKELADARAEFEEERTAVQKLLAACTSSVARCSSEILAEKATQGKAGLQLAAELTEAKKTEDLMREALESQVGSQRWQQLLQRVHARLQESQAKQLTASADKEPSGSPKNVDDNPADGLAVSRWTAEAGGRTESDAATQATGTAYEEARNRQAGDGNNTDSEPEKGLTAAGNRAEAAKVKDGVCEIERRIVEGQFDARITVDLLRTERAIAQNGVGLTAVSLGGTRSQMDSQGKGIHDDKWLQQGISRPIPQRHETARETAPGLFFGLALDTGGQRTGRGENEGTQEQRQAGTATADSGQPWRNPDGQSNPFQNPAIGLGREEFGKGGASGFNSSQKPVSVRGKRKCPVCKVLIAAAAADCSHCGHMLRPSKWNRHRSGLSLSTSSQRSGFQTQQNNVNISPQAMLQTEGGGPANGGSPTTGQASGQTGDGHVEVGGGTTVRQQDPKKGQQSGHTAEPMKWLHVGQPGGFSQGMQSDSVSSQPPLSDEQTMQSHVDIQLQIQQQLKALAEQQLLLQQHLYHQQQEEERDANKHQNSASESLPLPLKTMAVIDTHSHERPGSALDPLQGNLPLVRASVKEALTGLQEPVSTGLSLAGLLNTHQKASVPCVSSSVFSVPLSPSPSSPPGNASVSKHESSAGGEKVEAEGDESSPGNGTELLNMSEQKQRQVSDEREVEAASREGEGGQMSMKRWPDSGQHAVQNASTDAEGDVSEQPKGDFSWEGDRATKRPRT